MNLADRLEEVGGFSDYVSDEYCLVHSIDKYTVEARIYVEVTEPNGKVWTSERVIKMRLRSK